MPSWNIHIAHTEALLERNGAVSHTVRDANAFLFGNVVPDIFVGYMVPGIERPIPYRITHFATPEPIPKPREHEFWDTYVAPLILRLGDDDEVPGSGPLIRPASITPVTDTPATASVPGGAAPASVRPSESAPAVSPIRSLFDLTLGAWAHLVADNLWNTRVNEYLDARGERPSENFRIKKQADFDGYGRTLRITSVPRESEGLVRAAEAFPQYPIGQRYVHDTITVIHEIVRTNGGTSEHLPYRLLTDEFFEQTFNEVLDTVELSLKERL